MHEFTGQNIFSGIFFDRESIYAVKRFGRIVHSSWQGGGSDPVQLVQTETLASENLFYRFIELLNVLETESLNVCVIFRTFGTFCDIL